MGQGFGVGVAVLVVQGAGDAGVELGLLAEVAGFGGGIHYGLLVIRGQVR